MKKHLSLFLAVLLCFCCACSTGVPTPAPESSQTEISAPTDVEVGSPETEDSSTPVTNEAGISASPSTDGTPLKAHFIDVGQGDSILIQLPNGQIMLIDAGGDVRSYIRSLGINKIDYLIATHPHADHIAYMEDVVREFEIGAIYMPRVSHTSKTFENMLLAIQKKGLTIKTAKAGVSILSQDGLNVNIVAPVGNSYESLNDYSAVVKVTYKENAMLFTGDAEALSEGQITEDISADVLKVGHHGSTTSSSNAFLNKVKPSIAVISCGAGNSYGHPHAETLQKLEARAVRVYRTDLNGTVIITSDGKNLRVDTKKSNTPTVISPTPSGETGQLTSNDNTIVYITRTGKRYHREGCNSLSKSKIQSTVAEATQKGLTPCQNCNP